MFTTFVTQKTIFGQHSLQGAQKMFSGKLEFLHQELCNEPIFFFKLNRQFKRKFMGERQSLFYRTKSFG